MVPIAFCSCGVAHGGRGHGLCGVVSHSRVSFDCIGRLTISSYYEHLAPLSPIVIPDFSHPSTHRTFLTDEPVLAVTILTTASRHMKPKGEEPTRAPFTFMIGSGRIFAG